VRALLDTHSFLWTTLDDPRLSTVARQLIEDGANDIFLSAVTAWEIAIKHSVRRLDLPQAPEPYISSRIAIFGFEPLPISISHALRVAVLPRVHADPFDRLLVAQSQVERLPIITSDPHIVRYGVETIW
jgi:PIN domain nuclease of toxin-antitoxin system